jgi:hypothetical protein
MPVIRVDNQQSSIPRPLLVVKTRNKSSSRSKSPVIKSREIYAVKAITPDLLWSYIKVRESGRDPITRKPVLRGLKYAILWPNQWPKWLHARVKSEDLAAKLTGIELEPAWSASIARRLIDLDGRANNRWCFESEDDSPPASRVRNPAEDLLGY